MDTGYFGLKLGHVMFKGVFIGSLIPHISYGVALGLLLERYVRHEGTVFTATARRHGDASATPAYPKPTSGRVGAE